jgi:hypothetical protein
MNEHSIYICTNLETLADGYFEYDDIAEIEDALYEIIQAGGDVIERDHWQGPEYDDPRVTCQYDSNFHNWHGGKRKNRASVGITIKGVTYGYGSKWVVTHAENPPQWLRDLIDRADEAMTDKAIDLSVDRVIRSI